MKRVTVIQSQPQYIPTLKITPDQITGYYKYEGPKRKAWQKNVFTPSVSAQNELTQQKEKLAYSGEITVGSRKRLKECCSILFALSKLKKVVAPKSGKEFKFRIALITLTLSAPQGIITDRQIKSDVLAPFLRHFRKLGMWNYIWKSERQKNGNVHFHILTDTFLDQTLVRDFWNKCQSKLGFIALFHAKFGHSSPNSTDCKAVIQDAGMTNYMLKYMLKKSDNSDQLELGRSISAKDIGKIWDCSLNLKLKNDTADAVEDWQFELMDFQVNKDKLRVIKCDYCVIYVPVNLKLSQVTPQFLLDRLLAFLDKVRNFERGKIIV